MSRTTHKRYVHKRMASPIGTLTLVASDNGLAAILWEADLARDVLVSIGVEESGHPVLVETERQLEEYFGGRRQRFSLKLDPPGTPFQRKVWDALLTIPFGETRSYGEIARQVGHPGAARAVPSGGGIDRRAHGIWQRARREGATAGLRSGRHVQAVKWVAGSRRSGHTGGVMPQTTIGRDATWRTHTRRRRANRSAARRLAGPALVAYRVAPLAIQIVIGMVLLVTIWAALNWIVQVARKPSEVFFPVSGSLFKAPAQTWREFGPLFETHSTTVITPDLLASLAQMEGSGNPVARTYWRWRPSWNPFEVYRPASSAVGMFQITDGTFAEARRYCIHDHVVVEDGPWHDPRSCWFNALYTRVVPGHAVEMTSALLDRTVARTLGRHRIATAPLQQRQDLAAVIHLCGSGAGDAYARRGFRLRRGQRCGDHDARRYLAEVNLLKQQFARLAAAG